MSRISFKNYAKRARELSQHTEIAGRYAIQDKAERHILLDVLKKLVVQPGDSVLDIICGTGNLSIPLSFLCQKITGIDHKDVLQSFHRRCEGLNNLILTPGNFLDVEIDERFDKIMAYSVLHYLTDIKEVLNFIDKALVLLKPGGRVLFGDIPNTSQKQRFLDTEYGKRFLKEWNRKQAIPPQLDLIEDHQTAVFDDDAIIRLMGHIRLKGFHAYVLHQPQELPFGHTREGLLVIHPEKKSDTPLAK